MALILVTGAMGQLGNELKISSKKYFGNDFIFTDFDTLDITDGEALMQFIAKRKPGWIINCAVFTSVDKAEEEQEKAHMINALGVKNIVSVIRDSPCRLIHISTDYVFDGRSETPYRESDPVNPETVYGHTKLEGEKYALLHPHSLVIRTSWLYSLYGHNFVKTILRLAEGENPLRVVNDQVGSPTWAADLADAILEIISGVNNHQIAFNAGIYNYSNEGTCSWYEFALAILEEAGISKEVIPITTPEFPLPAKRPQYSVLNKSKITENYRLAIPHWRTSLSKCIKLMNK